MDLKINKKKFEIFLEVVKELNSQFNIIPILFGSLGLYRRIGEFGKANDIDILVPDSFLKERWSELIKIMESLNFKLSDEKEHEFVRKKEIVAFGNQGDLTKNCKIGSDALEISNINEVKFRELSPKQYLLVYKFMLRDNYRQEKLAKNDKEKINLIKEYLKEDKARATKPVSLNKKTTFILYPKPPYNFDTTVHKPSHFPSSDNEWEKGKYWITMLWRGKFLGLKLKNKGTMVKPKIELTVYSKKTLSEEFRQSLIPEIEWRFNLKSDISGFDKKLKKDKILNPLLKKWRGMKPVAANSFYETLVVYIILQNATVRRTHQMLENLFNKLGKKVKFDDKILSTFWEPRAIAKTPEQTLRDLKLGYRAKFLKRISEQFAKGEIDEFKMRRMPKEEVKKEALKLYGIGPASVEYLLFEDFYHCDALETIPPWEQKIMSKLLFNKKLVSTNKILNFFRKRYKGWEKLAFHYIWEDIFWKRKTQHIDWLEKEIRL